MLVVQGVVSIPDSGQRYHMRVLLVPIHDVLRNSRLRADGIQYAVGRMANNTIVYSLYRSHIRYGYTVWILYFRVYVDQWYTD